MSAVSSKIVDGITKFAAKVSAYGGLGVYQTTPPLEPEGELSRQRFFRSTLTAMNVDGSTTPVEFSQEADEDADIYITTATVIIADTAVVHSSFGNVSALANGFSLCVDEGGNIANLISEAKTGGQVIAQAGTMAGNAESASSYELINWTGTNDAQLIVLDLNQFIPGGVRIGRGTKGRIFAQVNDDLTGLTEFTIYLQGYKRFA